MQEKVEATLGKILMGGLLSVTLVVTPMWSLDPINPIKMLVVTAIGFMGLGVLLTNHKALALRRYTVPLGMIGGFMAWQLVVLLVSGGEKLQQIFGTTGRNTGFISYAGFTLLFVVSMVVSSSSYLNKFQITTVIVGVTSLTYGAVQIADADPFSWVNSYSPVIGFLGNPNFQSSLLGILGSIVFAHLISGSVNARTKVAYIAYLIGTLAVIRETISQQGFLVLAIGSFVAFAVYMRHISLNLLFVLLSFGFLSAVLGIFGLLNKGPLARILFDDSVAFRGDYWLAGWKMTLENPIFGVGLDSYGDWYRRSRSLEATLRRGPDVTSNAAHNVFLDFSSFGGFPLFLIYLSIMVLVIISAVKVIKRTKNYNAGFSSLVAGWVAFQAQSLISINQIGLAIWGWILSGLIIGFEINTRDDKILEGNQLAKRFPRPPQTSAATTLGMFVGLILGVIVAIPPYLASVEYRTALETGDPESIRNAAYIWPTDPTYMVQVAVTLNDNSLEKEGLKVILDATSKFPDDYAVWVALNLMKSASKEQKIEALAQMKRLDPLNPTLK
jgi:O-antigen ligase